ARVQVLVRDRRLGRFALPVNRYDPPAFAVVEQLNAVDSAREWLARLLVAGLVGAEHLGNVAVLFHTSGDFALEKSFFVEEWLRPRDVVVHGQDAGSYVASGLLGGRDQPCAGHKERAHPVPVALLTGSAGDDVIEGGHDAVHRADVFWLRGRCGWLRSACSGCLACLRWIGFGRRSGLGPPCGGKQRYKSDNKGSHAAEQDESCRSDGAKMLRKYVTAGARRLRECERHARGTREGRSEDGY